MYSFNTSTNDHLFFNVNFTLKENTRKLFSVIVSFIKDIHTDDCLEVLKILNKELEWNNTNFRIHMPDYMVCYCLGVGFENNKKVVKINEYFPLGSSLDTSFELVIPWELCDQNSFNLSVKEIYDYLVKQTNVTV